MRRSILAAVLALIAVAPDGALAKDADPFGYFIGAWRCDGVFPASGKTIASSLRFERDEASGALLKHHDDAPPGAYHALELWGFVHDGGFSNTIMDAYGGVRLFTSPGWSGDSLTWSDGRQRFAYLRLSPSRMRVDWSVINGAGDYRIGDTLTCERA